MNLINFEYDKYKIFKHYFVHNNYDLVIENLIKS